MSGDSFAQNYRGIYPACRRFLLCCEVSEETPPMRITPICHIASLSIAIIAATAALATPPVLTSSPTATGAVGTNFTYIATFNDGGQQGIPSGFAMQGTPPPGTGFTSTNQTLTGVPTTAGTFKPQFGAQNNNGLAWYTVTITITGGPSPTPTPTPSPTPTPTNGPTPTPTPTPTHTPTPTPTSGPTPTPTNGPTPTPTNGPTPTPTPTGTTLLPGQYVALNFIWRAIDNTNGPDRMSSNSTSEIAPFTFDGAIFYVPESAGSGQVPLYRLKSSSGVHMDSTATTEGPYTLDVRLGYPYSTQQAGTTQLIRKVNSGGYHALSMAAETLAGYSDEDMGIYGYPRYLQATEVYLNLSAGGVAIQSNLDAGGSLWSWTWNGMQFINDRDYGRQIQTSMSSVDLGGGLRANPTEAGSNAATLYGPFTQGSPVVSAANNGTTQSTRSIPLDFVPGSWGGGVQNPVLWANMQMGKDITLDYAGLGDSGNGSVAHYVTDVYVPTSTGEIIEIPTAYLNGNFSSVYSYDAQASNGMGTLTSISLMAFGQMQLVNVNYGGVILATPDSNFAMGIYGVSKAYGGSVSGYGVFNFYDSNPKDGTGQYGNSTFKMNAYSNVPLNAGWNYFSTYIVCGTLTEVTTLMHTLYTSGAN
jgi:hypothetical protein